MGGGQLANLRVLLAAGSGLGYQHNSFVDVKSTSTQRALCRPTNQTELVEWMITISYTENSFQICGSFALSRPQQPTTPGREYLTIQDTPVTCNNT